MITRYKDFLNENVNNQFFKTYEEIEKWLDGMCIKNYTINDDLTVDVDDNVIFNYNNKIHKGLPIQFGVVNGVFNYAFNYIENFIGSPKKVEYRISCNTNQIKTLDGLSIYNLKKNIDINWYQNLSSKIKEEYFDKNLDEHPEIFSLIDFELSNEFKDKWNHLFNASKFDLI